MKDSDRFNMSFVVSKTFSFEASHKLTLVPVKHKCGRLHGHSYRVRIYAKGFLNRKREWVEDYGDIKKAVKPIVKQLDHQYLNDILPYETTAENLAFWFGQQLCHLKWLHAVEVLETRSTSVRLDIR